MEVIQNQVALNVPVVGPNGESLASMKPARVRRYLQEERAVVASTHPFTIRLREREDSTTMTQDLLNPAAAPAQQQGIPTLTPQHAFNNEGVAPAPVQQMARPVGIQPPMAAQGQQMIRYSLIKNISGGPLKINDLKQRQDQEGFQFKPNEAYDLLRHFTPDLITGSRDLHRALFPTDGSFPKAVQMSSWDDPAGNEMSPEAALRGRVEAEIGKEIETVDDGRVSPGRQQLTSIRVKNRDYALDQDVQKVVNSNNQFDLQLRKRIMSEVAEDAMVQYGDLVD